MEMILNNKGSLLFLSTEGLINKNICLQNGKIIFANTSYSNHNINAYYFILTQ